jgi:hypothetical protein
MHVFWKWSYSAACCVDFKMVQEDPEETQLELNFEELSTEGTIDYRLNKC